MFFQVSIVVSTYTDRKFTIMSLNQVSYNEMATESKTTRFCEVMRSLLFYFFSGYKYLLLYAKLSAQNIYILFFTHYLTVHEV